MKEFEDYDSIYPELVYDIVDYFRLSNNVKPINSKSVLDYCLMSRFNQTREKGNIIQPSIVHMICENLSKRGILNRLKVGQKFGGTDANYAYLCNNDEVFLSKHPVLIFRLNCIAYGFLYVYESYRQYVLPVIVKNSKGDLSVGTCFRFHTGILTAKHCLTEPEVSIKGYTAEQLNQCPVIISTDPNVDMAFIDLNEQSPISYGEAKILDEVLAMGYPKVPMFNEFLAVERAAISSIPTKGAVASLANPYMARDMSNLMLVTARIRGGNSGGPIINSDGAVVGVAFAEPMSKGDYDEMGYGIAYPINVFFQMLNSYETMKVNFVENLL